MANSLGSNQYQLMQQMGFLQPQPTLQSLMAQCNQSSTGMGMGMGMAMPAFQANEIGGTNACLQQMPTTPGTALQTNAPQASNCADGQDDGHISLWEKIKGIGKGVVNLAKGMFFDRDGNFSIGRTLTTVGVAALCIATAGTAVPAVIAGIGLVTAGAGLVKASYHAATATTDAEAEQAWEGIGENGAGAVLAFTGAKASLKAMPEANVASYSGVKGFGNVIKDSTLKPLSDAYHTIKNGNIRESFGTFKNTVKENFKTGTDLAGCRKAEHDSRIKEFDERINKLEESKIKAKEGETLTKADIKKNDNIEAQIAKVKAEQTNYNAVINDMNEAQAQGIGNVNERVNKYQDDVRNAEKELCKKQAKDSGATKEEIAEAQENLDAAKAKYKLAEQQRKEIASEMQNILSQQKALKKQIESCTDKTKSTKLNTKLDEINAKAKQYNMDKVKAEKSKNTENNEAETQTTAQAEKPKTPRQKAEDALKTKEEALKKMKKEDKGYSAQQEAVYKAKQKVEDEKILERTQKANSTRAYLTAIHKYNNQIYGTNLHKVPFTKYTVSDGTIYTSKMATITNNTFATSNYNNTQVQGGQTVPIGQIGQVQMGTPQWACTGQAGFDPTKMQMA